MTDSDFTDEELEAQAGEHNINTTPSLTDKEEGFLEFEFESKAVFELFAKDIYKNDEAGIREPLSNALTAIKRAEAKFGIENGGVEITLKDHGPDGQKVIIQDNGVGISEQVLKEALLIIGRSLNRDYGKVSGKYGIGFLACYKTVGSSGGFEMYSRSRETDEYISGIWRPGGFDRDLDNELPTPLDEDQYGTRLEFYLREDISKSQIREWVEKNAKWARYPVMYTEEDSTGEIEFEEDYGSRSFISEYDTTSEFLKIENEHFTAVCSPYSTGRTLLLDSPIERNFNGLTRNPWNIDIRIKNENGVIIEGEYAGLSPVSENEYKNMSDARKKRYVPESKLAGDELKLPEPVGTRETLTENDAFWYWLGERFEKKYRQFVKNTVQEVTTVEDILEMKSGNIKLLLKSIDEFNIPEINQHKFKQSFDSEFDVSLNQSQVDLLLTLKEPVEFYKPNDEYTNGAKTSREAYRLVIQHQKEGGTVYMGVSLNDIKNKIIWEDNRDNAVVQVENSEEYDKYKRTLSWEKQRLITTKTIDEFDISTELKDQFLQQSQFETSEEDSESQTKSQSQLPVEERVLKIHTSKAKKADHTLTVEKVYTSLQNETAPFEKLIVFTPRTEKKLSEKKWIATDDIAVANCTVGMFEYLSELENVYTIDTHYERARKTTVTTSEGQIAVEEVLNRPTDFGKIYFHPLPDEIWKEVSSESIRGEFEKYLLNEVTDIVWTKQSEIEYIPIPKTQLENTLKPIFDNDEWRLKDSMYILTTDEEEYENLARTIELKNPLHAYAYSCLSKWQDNPLLDIIASLHLPLTDGGVELIETLRTLHDTGVEPATINLDELRTVENISFETSNGTLTVDEIKSHPFPIFHIVPLDSVKAFKTQFIYEYAEEFIREVLLDDYDSVQEADELLYIPVTPIEYSEISPVLTDNTHYLRGEINDSVKQQLDGVSHNLYTDTQLYAYARLHRLKGTETFNRLIETRVEFTEGGYKIVETIAKSIRDR